MAGIMERIALIVRSEARDFAERHEDAERVINQTIADAMVSYASLRRELEPLATSEAQAKGRLDALTDEAGRWHSVARKALVAGNEGDARTALSREQDLKERIASQQGIYDQLHEVAERLRTQLAQIEDGISQLQAQMARVKGKETTARATEMSARVSSGSDTLDAREAAADWELATAEGTAAARRVAYDPFAGLGQVSERIPSGAAGTDVDAQLAALRAQLEADDD